MPAPTQRPISSPAADGVPLDLFLAELSGSAVLPPAEVQSLKKQAAPASGQNCLPFVKGLVKSRKLTKYQATTILRGMGRELTLDNYVVLDKLGEGGMGMVYNARHRKLGQVVALKVLSPAVTSKPTAVKRFLREVRAVSKLRHPNIVAASDAGEDKGGNFLVMEYVEGSDLAQLVKQSGPLAVSQACDYIRAFPLASASRRRDRGGFARAGGAAAGPDRGLRQTDPGAGQPALPARFEPHPVLGYVLKQCPADAVEYKGHWYKFYPEGIASWEEARTRCRELGGYLACVQGLEEHQFLLQLRGRERQPGWEGRATRARSGPGSPASRGR